MINKLKCYVGSYPPFNTAMQEQAFKLWKDRKMDTFDISVKLGVHESTIYNFLHRLIR